MRLTPLRGRRATAAHAIQDRGGGCISRTDANVPLSQHRGGRALVHGFLAIGSRRNQA
jgi:hypothetical protein